jgi:hypothetical protein
VSMKPATDSPITLILYGRPDCGLCDEMAEAIAEQFGARVVLDKRDITGDAQLERRFGLKIPVLMREGEVICFGRLDEARLQQLLDAID